EPAGAESARRLDERARVDRTNAGVDGTEYERQRERDVQERENERVPGGADIRDDRRQRTAVVTDPRERVADANHEKDRRAEQRQQRQRLHDAARSRYAQVQQQLRRQHQRQRDNDRDRGEFQRVHERGGEADLARRRRREDLPVRGEADATVHVILDGEADRRDERPDEVDAGDDQDDPTQHA